MKFNAIASILTIFFTFSALAGPGSGNGGKGVMINGKPYLLDLVEAGLEKDPYFNSSITPTQEVSTRVAKVFASAPSVPINLVAQKLQEVYKQQYSAAVLMLKTMELYRWRFVSKDLIPIDDQRDAVKVEAKDYVQLAKRVERSILINRDLWAAMDDKNRTALIFHELNYAYAKPVKIGDGVLAQDIGAVQEATAFLFSEELFSTDQLASMIAPIFPSEAFFSGSWIVFDQNINYFQLTPDVELFFADDINGRAGQVAFETSGLFFLLPDLKIKDLISHAANETCGKLPDHKVFLKSVTNAPTIVTMIDNYTGANGQVFSYVKVTRIISESGSGGLEVNSANCPAQVAILFNEINGRLNFSFKRIF